MPLKATNTTSVEQPTLPDARQEITINVTVEGGNNGVLYSLGQPVSADKNSEIRTGDDPADVSSLKPTDHFKNGDTYAVTGTVAVPSVDELRTAGTDYPDWVRQTYLQLPSNLPGRVGAKALDVTRGATTPYEMATDIEAYLRTFPNDYGVPVTPPGRDTVDYFLFDLQRGYFDYHASAMAVMLRTLGIPARVASGYALDPSTAGRRRDVQPDGAERVLVAGGVLPEHRLGGVQPHADAAADPAPGRAAAGGGDRRRLDTGPERVADPRPGDHVAARASGAGRRRGDCRMSSSTPWLLILAIVAGVAALLAGGAKVAWEWGMGGLSRPAQLWEKTARLATLAGVRPVTYETPREFSARLGEQRGRGGGRGLPGGCVRADAVRAEATRRGRGRARGVGVAVGAERAGAAGVAAGVVGRLAVAIGAASAGAYSAPT